MPLRHPPKSHPPVTCYNRCIMSYFYDGNEKIRVLFYTDPHHVGTVFIVIDFDDGVTDAITFSVLCVDLDELLEEYRGKKKTSTKSIDF